MKFAGSAMDCFEAYVARVYKYRKRTVATHIKEALLLMPCYPSYGTVFVNGCY